MMPKSVCKWMAVLSICLVGLMASSGCGHEKAAVAATEKDKKEISVTEAPTPNGPRIVATSMSTVYIMEKLDVDLVGIPHSEVDKVPKRYKKVPEIGSPMSPDQEKLAMLQAEWIFSPASLASDLLPTYEKLHLNYGFLNLNNIPGMYKSIEDLGNLLNRREQATQLVNEYEHFMKIYRERHPGGSKKKVLILMGLPGSYVVATEHSYAGSLVKLAGAENVYGNEKQPFLNVNVEDMLKKDPDIILRTSHAMPEDVQKMFAKEFAENPNWKHFRAVEQHKVYDLNHDRFGMSAKFNYPEALADLEEILYVS